MLFRIDTINPYSRDLEYYVVGAVSEKEARIKFYKEVPSSFEIKDIFQISGDLLRIAKDW